MANVSVDFLDWGGDPSSLVLPVDDAITDAQITALWNATLGVTVAGAQGSRLKIDSDKDSGTPGNASDPNAQREKKWLITFTDNVTGEELQRECPCSDLSRLAAASENMDVGTGTQGETFRDALNTHLRNPRTGNQCTVQSIRFVGRNI